MIKQYAIAREDLTNPVSEPTVSDTKTYWLRAGAQIDCDILNALSLEVQEGKAVYYVVTRVAGTHDNYRRAGAK